VGPGIQAALTALEEARKNLPLARVPILVLATRATVQSHAYGKALRDALGHGLDPEQDSPPVIEQACPLLVPMIEEGWIDHPILHQTIMEYLRPHAQLHSEGIALLGCTHYPWIHKAFEKALPGWTVVNSAQAIADSLEKANIGKRRRKKAPSESPIEWIFTDPEAVPSFARNLMER
jgi:glutamate racemase